MEKIQNSKVPRSLKWVVGTLIFFDSRGKTLEKKFPHSKFIITLWEPYYISPSRNRNYLVSFARKDSIAIYHEIIYRDISYLRYIVKYLHKIRNNFQKISIYCSKWYITIYQNIFIKFNIDISWYIILLNILRYMKYIDIF